MIAGTTCDYCGQVHETYIMCDHCKRAIWAFGTKTPDGHFHNKCMVERIMMEQMRRQAELPLLSETEFNRQTFGNW